MFIYLIRHGQSEGNREGDKYGIIHGRLDKSGLTEIGKKQIENIANTFKNSFQTNRFIICYSPTVRTKESAQIFAKITQSSKFYSSELLYDVDFGEFENKTWPEIIAKNPIWLLKFQRDRLNTPFIRGESKKNLQVRVEKFIQDEILSSSNENHIIITHEEVIRTFFSLLLEDNFYYVNRSQLKIPNGSASILLVNKTVTVPIQVGKTDLPFQLNKDNILRTHNWLTQQNLNPYEFIPKQNYSENAVFTVRFNEHQETVKMVPVEFLNDVEKDIHLSEEASKFGLPVPKYLKCEIKGDYIFIRRSYLPGKIAQEWFTSSYKTEALSIMAKVMSKLHTFPLSRLKIKINTLKAWKENFLYSWIKSDLEVLKKINSAEVNRIREFYNNFLHDFETNTITFLHNDLSTHNLTMKKQDDNLFLSGIWDFERAFSGDPLWDLGVTQKISFLKNQKDFVLFMQSYFKRTPTPEEIKTIDTYTLMNTTGAIRYRFERNKPLDLELNNLNYLCKKIGLC